MCGISGFFRMGKIKPKEENIVHMLKESEFRGKDATGVGWTEKGKLKVTKVNLTAKEFLKLDEFPDVSQRLRVSRWAVLHTRAATHGDAKNNKNNHPIIGKGGILIHNGIAQATKEFKAKGETDSEQILLSIQNLGWKKGLGNISGSLAIAVVLAKELNSVYLFRHDSPIKVGWDYKRNIMYWGSTYEILPPLPRRWGVLIDSGELQEDVLYRINSEGITKVMTIKMPKPKYIKYHYNQYDGYWTNGFRENYNKVFSKGEYAKKTQSEMFTVEGFKAGARIPKKQKLSEDNLRERMYERAKILGGIR